MKIDISAFYTAKAGSELKECQDSCSVNANNRAFAVSDGVTQSLFSDIWSKIITRSYVDNPDTFVQKNGEKTLNPALGIEFNKQFQERYDSLGSMQKRIVNISKTKTPYSAATFVGFRMEGRKAVVEALGDSVLFQYRKSDGRVDAVCSMMKNGRLAFDNSPEYFASNGIMNGRVVTKEINVEEGTILVMTDAIAAWFNDQQEKTSVIRQMSKLGNHDEYHNFIESLRREGLKDDDCTILLLNIEEDQKEELTMNILHLDEGVVYPSSENPSTCEDSPTDNPTDVPIDNSSVLNTIKKHIEEIFIELRKIGDRLHIVESTTKITRQEQVSIMNRLSIVEEKNKEIVCLKKDIASLNDKLREQAVIIKELKSEILKIKTSSKSKEYGLVDCIIVSLKRLISLFKRS